VASPIPKATSLIEIEAAQNSLRGKLGRPFVCF